MRADADWRNIGLVVLAFVAIWFVLDQSARVLGSFRGEAGVPVALLVLVAAVGAEVWLFRTKLREVPELLGLRMPNFSGTIAALALAAALVCFFPLFSWLTGTPINLVDNWPWLAIGIFAQAGIAEEVLFRGFLFRRFRQGRSFWRASGLAAIPFVAVHLFIFLTLDFAVALASVLVSLSLAFPLAWLFEKSGNSIWPPAIVHALIQGAIKLAIVPQETFTTLAIVWMALSAFAPWLFFLVRDTSRVSPQ